MLSTQICVRMYPKAHEVVSTVQLVWDSLAVWLVAIPCLNTSSTAPPSEDLQLWHINEVYSGFLQSLLATPTPDCQ